ncbi:MAG: hypothetical protein NZ519_08760 [Bacteroidia bacterium]|nr:hypothetical protein [Bacteroidia bacterium]
MVHVVKIRVLWDGEVCFLREACGGWALAQCGAKRSTEAIA